MKALTIRLCAGLLTFLVGVLIAGVSPEVRRRPCSGVALVPAGRPPAAASSSTLPMTGHFINDEDLMPVEYRAVMVAEEFIRQNGYTAMPADRNGLSYEAVETADGIEGMLLDRFDTLERNAYGFRYGGRNGKSGYTVVFRYTNRMGDYSKEVGRAVTMDADFHNLRVEHKDFFLTKVHKRVR